MKKKILCSVVGVITATALLVFTMSTAGYLTNTSKVIQAVEQAGYSDVKLTARHPLLPFLHGCRSRDNAAFDVAAVKTEELAAAIKRHFDRINHQQQLENDELAVRNDELRIDIARLQGRRPDYQTIDVDRARLAATQLVVRLENSALFRDFDRPPKVYRMTACAGFLKQVTLGPVPDNALEPKDSVDH